MMNLGQIGDIGLVYDGIPLSDFFIVRGVDMPILPTIETNSLEIDGKPGAWFTSRNIGTRDITVRLAILGDNKDRITTMEQWINASDKLSKGEEHKLELGNGFYVNAIMTGNSDWDRNHTWNTTEIVFRCFDPFIYGQTWTEEIKAGKNSIPIHGKYPTFPVYDITGVNGALELKDETAHKTIRVPGLVTDTKLVIDMAKYHCTVNGYYKAADPTVSDFWAVKPGVADINLNQGKGTLTYTERYL